MLICEKAYFKDNDQRGKIMCKISNLPCAHSHYCSHSMKYRQLNSAYQCPGREEK